MHRSIRIGKLSLRCGVQWAMLLACLAGCRSIELPPIEPAAQPCDPGGECVEGLRCVRGVCVAEPDGGDAGPPDGSHDDAGHSDDGQSAEGPPVTADPDSSPASPDAAPPPGPVTFGTTPIFADEFNGSTFWADAETSANGLWQNFTSYGGPTWKEGHNDHAQARLVDRPGAVRALAIESQPLIRVGTTVGWCRWAMGKTMLGTTERDQALERCRVRTAYLRTYNGWSNGVQQGAKFGPGSRFEVRVSFAEAIRPGQLFDFWLQVEKPQSLYSDEEHQRRLAGAGGVAYDGLADNGTEIDIFEFGYGHRTWNTGWTGLKDVSRFNTAMHFDRRAPYDASTNPHGRTGPDRISRIVDTLNQEPLFGTLSHLSAVHGNGPGAVFDLRSGWYVFTLEWIETGDGRSRLDFYLKPDNGDPGEQRHKYFEIPDFQTYDTSADHFLVLSNEVDQGFTGFQDGVWRYIEQGPNADDHNTPTSTTTVITAEGPQTFDAYPEDRILIDWVRVYAQQ